MSLAAAALEIAQDPLAIGLLGAAGVVTRVQHLAPLVHQRKAGIQAKFRLILLLTLNIGISGTPVHLYGVI
jgi:hypothetical protein